MAKSLEKIYLDYAASTPVSSGVLEKMLPYMVEEFGNPSSMHSFGREARTALEEARDTLADILGCQPMEIVFTSSATESNNLAINGIALAYKELGKHIIVSSIEHPCVLESARALERDGFNVTFVAVDREGGIDPKDVERALRQDTIIISIMHANNEIGTIQPVAEIAKIINTVRKNRSNKIPLLHTDAAQTFTRLPVKVDVLGADLLTVSSQKIYGPKGAALLYIREGVKIKPLLYGGGQEDGRRSSTINVPAIVGFAEAARIGEEGCEKEHVRLSGLSERLINMVRERIHGVHINGSEENRVPHIVNMRFDKVDGADLMLGLDAKGFSVATGSGCSSAKIEPSHTLLACGLSSEKARESIRISFGKGTRLHDIDNLTEAIVFVVGKLRNANK